jgi:hypothetical protein
MEIPNDSEANVEDSFLVSLHQLSKGPFITLLSLLDQDLIADIHGDSVREAKLQNNYRFRTHISI